MPPQKDDFTTLLHAMQAGDSAAGDQALDLVYQELRRVAGRYFRHERKDHTLQPTALVHEAYLRMVKSESLRPRDRTHFIALAATQMRRILIEAARARHALKRGEAPIRVTLSGNEILQDRDMESLIDLDAALNALHDVDPRAATVVELRFFGGLKESEVAIWLDVSEGTVGRDWTFARSFLAARLG